MSKRWRVIPSCIGYAASEGGHIHNCRTGQRLYGAIDRYGYRYVNLTVNGRCVKRKVHRLVAEAFHGPCPLGLECAHLNGDKGNNCPDNLAWVTRSENTRHQIMHGTFSHTNGIRLSDETVAQIRDDAKRGLGGRKLSAKYGISRSHAYRLVREQQRSPKGDAQ
jgi:hypothetical protein